MRVVVGQAFGLGFWALGFLCVLRGFRAQGLGILKVALYRGFKGFCKPGYSGYIGCYRVLKGFFGFL